MKSKYESHFLVALNGLDLSKEQTLRIEQSIREIVLREVAHIDNRADMKMSSRFVGHPTWKDLWERGQLAGFWIRGYPDFPAGGPNG